MRIAWRAACFAGLLWSDVVLAATVDPIEGRVSINRGNGFQRIAQQVIGNAGDRVMAGQGSTAQVVYADGCIVSVDPGAVYTIAESSPCTAGAGVVPPEAIALGAAAIGVGIYVLTKPNSSSP